MLPIRRDFKFKLPSEKILSWNPRPISGHFMNSLSILFPVGERFFIDSVRQYRDNGVIQDEELIEQIRGFIGQEAMHGREHEEYNEAYDQAGFGAAKVEEFVYQLLEVVKKGPPGFRLAGTIALEHFTAILANALLDNPEIIEGADEQFKAIWNWHALEETEHKAVAFDVYVKAFEERKLQGYALRVFAMVLATAILWAVLTPVWIRNVAKDGLLFNLKEWRYALGNLFGKHGVLSNSFFPYLDYFKPGFHPWDHDNRHFLEQVDELVARYAA